MAVLLLSVDIRYCIVHCVLYYTVYSTVLYHTITNMYSIFETGKFADCTVACEGREFRCHKNILAGRLVLCTVQLLLYIIITNLGLLCSMQKMI